MTATVPSSSVIAATVQQPVSPPVVTTTMQVVDPDNPEWTCDPNEPRYCICNQVSYGDMVACDNSDVSFLLIFSNVRTNKLCNDDNYVISVPSNGSITLVWASAHHQRVNGTVLSAHLR